MSNAFFANFYLVRKSEIKVTIVSTQFCIFNNLRIFRKYTYKISHKERGVFIIFRLLLRGLPFSCNISSPKPQVSGVCYTTCMESIFAQYVRDNGEGSFITGWLFVQYIL